jgi:hypothetical protein
MATFTKSITSLQRVNFKVAPAAANSSAAPVYWCEFGVVYQMASGGSGASIVVGFSDFNCFASYCSRITNWSPAKSSFYGRTPFSNQDFPALQDTAPNPNKNPTYGQYQIFASQYAAPFALSFFSSAGISEAGIGRPSVVYTLVSWSQAAALPVQSPQGAQTVALTYLTLSQSKTARYGTEIIWLGPPV